MSIGISLGDLQATAASIPHQIPATPMHLYNGVTMHRLLCERNRAHSPCRQVQRPVN